MQDLISTFIDLAIGVLIIGYAYRVMHWPGAGLMIVLSKTAIGILYPYQFMRRQKKRTRIDNLKVLFILLWVFTGILPLLLEKRINALDAVSWACLVAWLTVALYEFMQSENPEEQQTLFSKLVTIAFIVGSVLFTTGMLLKMLHWPGAGPLMITGGLLGAVSLFQNLFNKEDEPAE